MRIKEVVAVSTIILLVFMGLVFAGLFYKEEIQPKRYNSITRMAKRDLEAARSRGDIDKGGRCYYGEHKVF